MILGSNRCFRRLLKSLGAFGTFVSESADYCESASGKNFDSNGTTNLTPLP